MVATDRISAFDVVLPNGIPDKGKVLTQLSMYWFEKSRDLVPNHVVTADFDAYPDQLKPYRDQLELRSMLVANLEPIPVRVRRTRLSVRLRLEGVSQPAERLRDRTARGDATR